MYNYIHVHVGLECYISEEHEEAAIVLCCFHAHDIESFDKPGTCIYKPNPRYHMLNTRSLL